MPRTTLDIDQTVLAQLRERAKAEGKSMGEVASERLAVALHDKPAAARFQWLSKDMGAFRIDLEDKDAVWALLDAEDLAERSG